MAYGLGLYVLVETWEMDLGFRINGAFLQSWWDPSSRDCQEP